MAEAKRVIVTGATGLIGSRLCQELVQRGYELVVFSRDPEAARAKVAGAAAYVAWQPEEDSPWAAYIDGAYGVVNLAAAPSIPLASDRRGRASARRHRAAYAGLMGWSGQWRRRR